MVSARSALPLSMVLVLLLFQTAAAQQDSGLAPGSCRDTPAVELFEIISYIQFLPTIKPADLEPVACLGARKDEDGEIFAELKNLYYELEGHKDRMPALLAIDRALVNLDPEDALDFLRRDLDHGDEAYRCTAILALGQLDNEEVLREIVDMRLEASVKNQVTAVLLSKSYEQTRVFILEMLQYREYASVDMAVKVLKHYFERDAITLSPEDEELFDLLERLTEQRSAYTSKAKVAKLIDSLRTLPGAPDPE